MADSKGAKVDVGKVSASATSEEAGEVVSQVVQLDPQIEASILRKLDFRQACQSWLLPVLSLMYFFNSLDRSNLGNAKTDGLEEDLGLKGNEYSLTLVLFYITFCGLDLPSNLLLKRFSGKIMLPTMMVGWGSVTLLQCAAYNWGGLLACRLLMGAFEAGFFAGVIFYLTQFYKRNEIAFRLSIFYGTTTVAGAFSGLISFGVFQIKDPSIPGWKYLFIIEGSGTILTAILAFFHLPKSGSKCHWFTEEESLVEELRLLQDGSIKTDEEFNLREALSAIVDWRIFTWATSCFCYGIAQASVSNFLPQMVKRLGYSTVKTNLYTVAPYCVGTVVLLALCKSSDHFRERSFHMSFSLLLTFIGYIILIAVDSETHKGVTYFACFLLCSGAFAPSCLFHTWHTNNVAAESQRAAVTGFLVGAANSAGIVSSLSFNAKTAPKYMPALIVACVFQVVGIIILISLGMWFRMDNHRRNKAQGVNLTAADVPTGSLIGGSKDPNWRWTA
ncbi:MAG: hypothetical protein M1834_005713 [Cirrosporium novae-zelandiae]|nr:MAG: hypothetical protein M1834_005713 [Cirrosporium novae-zelandiae]